jgi:hypothetical protein
VAAGTTATDPWPDAPVPTLPATLPIAAILKPDDGWYRAIGAELEARDPDDRRPLSALLSVDRGARPNQNAQWVRQVHDLGLTRRRWAARALPRMLDALAEATPAVQPGGQADGRPLLVAHANTACAVNVIWAAVELGLDDGTQTIGRILHRCVAEPWTMQSVRIRNACANALAEIGSPKAVDLLAEAAGEAASKAVREQLFLCVDVATGRGERPPSRLAELHVPRHGLDALGCREMIVHRHRFDLQLLPDGQMCVAQWGEGSTPDAAVRRVVAAESRGVRATYRKEAARIEALLATERDWTPGEWQRIYHDNPITRAVASRLIWRHTYEDGRAIDRIPEWNGKGVVAYPAEGTHWSDPPRAELPYRISLWHPRDADPALLATWRGACRARRIVQPFEQIERDFTRLAPDSDAAELSQYAGPVAEADRFAGTVRRLGWRSLSKRPGARTDSVRMIYRTFPDARLWLVVPVTEAGPDGAAVLSAGWFHRAEDRSRTPLPLGAIAPRVYSEAARDLSLLAYGSRQPEDEIPLSESFESRDLEDEVPLSYGPGNRVPEDEIPDRLG